MFFSIREISVLYLCMSCTHSDMYFILQGMMVKIWLGFLKTLKGALWWWWTAGAWRSSQMRVRRRVTRCHMKSLTTTSLLELWVSDKCITGEGEVWIFLCYFFNNCCFALRQDASIAHRFHTMREKHPQKFNSRYAFMSFFMNTKQTASKILRIV